MQKREMNATMTVGEARRGNGEDYLRNPFCVVFVSLMTTQPATGKFRGSK